MNEETYKMKFECKNCFNKFTDEIPYGKKLKVESGVGYHEIYYGLNRIKGTVIECPKCGTSDDIYKVKREEKEKEAYSMSAKEVKKNTLKCPNGHKTFNIIWTAPYGDPCIVLKCVKCQATKVVPIFRNSLSATGWGGEVKGKEGVMRMNRE